ncbi:MAG: hemerythrin family protein [Myxococcota bacterium]
MGIELTDDLLTGVYAIDEQHRELFRRINAFLSACNDERGADRVRETLEFMRLYALDHFRNEEVMMAVRGYPDIVAHKQQHAELIAVVGKLEAKLQQEGASENVVATTRRVLVEWLVNHIRKHDKSLAAHLRDMGAL